MAVPAHDQRDFEFCRKYGVPVWPVIRPVDGTLAEGASMETAFPDDGTVENSGEFTGLPSEEARRRMSAKAEAEGFGKAAITYRIRDWGISRQRYWGTPIPVIHCERCGVVPVPEDQLPVVLPLNVKITGTGRSPLESVPEFMKVKCPHCGGAARRESDTMDTFAPRGAASAGPEPAIRQGRGRLPGPVPHPMSGAGAKPWKEGQSSVLGRPHRLEHDPPKSSPTFRKGFMLWRQGSGKTLNWSPRQQGLRITPT
jgi:hypothetical protein